MSAHEGAHARERLHGFHLSSQDELLLRGPVPEQALRWAAAEVGAGARVRAWRALAGGTSSAVHALTVERRDGRAHAATSSGRAVG